MKVVYEPPAAPHAPELYACEGRFHTRRATLGEKVALADFARDGSLVPGSPFTDAQIAAARTELSAMTRADDPACGLIAFEGTLPPDLPAAERARYVRKFMDFTGQHPALAALAHHPALREAARALLGEEPRLFQEMALIKPPGGREKPWHQDHAYFNLPLDTKILGVWIALESASVENGCMCVLPGGHKDGPRPHFMRRDWQLCDSESLNFAAVAVPMAPGEVLLFDGKLPHGTPVNRTDDTRWALQFHYVGASAAPADESVRLAAFGGEGKGASC